MCRAHQGVLYRHAGEMRAEQHRAARLQIAGLRKPRSKFADSSRQASCAKSAKAAVRVDSEMGHRHWRLANRHDVSGNISGLDLRYSMNRCVLEIRYSAFFCRTPQRHSTGVRQRVRLGEVRKCEEHPLQQLPWVDAR